MLTLPLPVGPPASLQLDALLAAAVSDVLAAPASKGVVAVGFVSGSFGSSATLGGEAGRDGASSRGAGGRDAGAAVAALELAAVLALGVADASAAGDAVGAEAGGVAAELGKEADVGGSVLAATGDFTGIPAPTRRGWSFPLNQAPRTAPTKTIATAGTSQVFLFGSG
jgi:hypothetical protein